MRQFNDDDFKAEINEMILQKQTRLNDYKSKLEQDWVFLPIMDSYKKDIVTLQAKLLDLILLK